MTNMVIKESKLFTFRCVKCKKLYGSNMVNGFPPTIQLKCHGKLDEKKEMVYDSVCVKCWEEKNGNWTLQHPRLHQEQMCKCNTPPSKEDVKNV